MRKNLLAKVTNAPSPQGQTEARSEYARRGASRSMMMSIDELAENAKRMASGEAVVELDPSLVDGSFVQDRLGDDAEDFAALKAAIRLQGQSTPILVRLHPERDGRYMTVFGHRRLKAARELGVPVRAIIKDMEAITHVIMQGQENSARANLSFIERALFARKLQDAGQAKDVIKVALSIDDTLLSRMLSVVETVPVSVIEALGPLKNVGRDRWEALKKLLLRPQALQRAKQIIETTEFLEKEAPARFDHLMTTVKISGRRSVPPGSLPVKWEPKDASVKAEIRRSGKIFSISLGASNARAFGDFISSQLDELYGAFTAQQKHSKPGV
jgi:ParB family transcriptional regulator, chromosome partitioning protein